MLLQDILKELTIRGAREEGILRIPGNKQRTEFLYVELEKNFYLRYDTVHDLLAKAGVHDLSTLLKRWLRELPMPLLATELVHLFYQSHGESSSCVLIALNGWMTKKISFNFVLKQSRHQINTKPYPFYVYSFPMKTEILWERYWNFWRILLACKVSTKCHYKMLQRS